MRPDPTIDAAPERYCPQCEETFAGGTACPNDGARLVVFRPPADPNVGRELDGRFTILDKLGDGGMGAVYRARQHSVDREVAIKVIHAHLIADPAVIKQFLREARLASRLSHPNAVSVLDFGQTTDGLFYLVMELLAGRTLDQVLQTDGAFGARRLIQLGIQVCDALEAAHALSIIHRDLKPANIVLLESARDFVKVLDFGLAKSLAADERLEISQPGLLAGTPAYVAPERACDQPCDARSDLYSLGCILYLVGSGSLPFDAGTLQEQLLRQVTEPPPPMTGQPAAVAAVIDRLLRKDPAERFQTAADTRAALEAALDEVRMPTEPGADPRAPSQRYRAIAADRPAQLHAPTLRTRHRRRRRWPWAVALAAAAGVLAALVASKPGEGAAEARRRAPELCPAPSAPPAPPAPPTVTPPALTAPAAPAPRPVKPRSARPARPKLPF